MQLQSITKFRKTFSFFFQAKVVVAEQTEKDIDETRSQYIPVAVRTQILFFCTYDLVCKLLTFDWGSGSSGRD